MWGEGQRNIYLPFFPFCSRSHAAKGTKKYIDHGKSLGFPAHLTLLSLARGLQAALADGLWMAVGNKRGLDDENDKKITRASDEPSR